MITNTAQKSPVHTGDGIVDTFTYPFLTTADSQVVLWKKDTLTGALSSPTNFTIIANSHDNESGGSVTYPNDASAKLLSTDRLIILRANTLLQETDFKNQEEYSPQDHEDSLDYMTKLIQQIDEVGDRSLKMSELEGSFDTKLPEPSASRLLSTNLTNDGFLWVSTANGPVALSDLDTTGAVVNDVIQYFGGVWARRAKLTLSDDLEMLKNGGVMTFHDDILGADKDGTIQMTGSSLVIEGEASVSLGVASVSLMTLSAGLFTPGADGTIDLGASGTQFKDLFLSGTATIGGSTPIAGMLDEDTLVTDSATHAATQQSIKAYVDASASTELHSARVDEAVGINKGEVVYVTGAQGSQMEVGLADNSIYVESSAIAIAHETGADNDTIDIITSGLLEGIDTSSFTTGDALYLGTSGVIVNVHPGGTDAVVKVGYAVKINASTGSMWVHIKNSTDVHDFDGTARNSVVNVNAGVSAVSSSTWINDAGHRASISMSGSNHTFGEDSSFFADGYGEMNFLNNGNHSFQWYTDPTDSHNPANLVVKMTLTAAGGLDLSAEGASVNVGTRADSAYAMVVESLTDDSTSGFRVNRNGNTDFLSMGMFTSADIIFSHTGTKAFNINNKESASSINLQINGVSGYTLGSSLDSTFAGVGSFVGDLTVGDGTNDPDLIIDGAVNNKVISYRTGGLGRIDVGINNTAEGGSNAGSDYYINTFTDAGAFLATPFVIERSTSKATFGGAVWLGGAVPTTTPNSNADDLVISASSHVGMTFNTETTAATLNMYFQDDVAGVFARIRSHGSTHANAEELWFYSGGDVLGLKLNGSESTFVGNIVQEAGDILVARSATTGIYGNVSGSRRSGLSFNGSNEILFKAGSAVTAGTFTATGDLELVNELRRGSGTIINAVWDSLGDNITSYGTSPRFYMQGTSSAAMILGDSSGTVDERVSGFDNNGGEMSISKWNDAGTVQTDYIICQLSSQQITMPGLAGTGTRNVVVSATGVLSAP